MARFSLVQLIALFWGFAVFLPVGLNYAAFAALGVALAAGGGWRERLERLRGVPNWWAAWLFLGWSALVLLFGARYPETAINAAHVLRIALTLLMVLALTRGEAVWAMRGFWLGALWALLLAALAALDVLPPGVIWHHITNYNGNKSIANAALLALAAGSALLLTPLLAGWRRALALALAAGALAVLVTALPSRTAWLALLLGVLTGLLHQLRARRQRQLLVLLAALLLALGAVMLAPGVRQRLELGAHEVAQASAGQQVAPVSSWGVRFRLYSETLEMVRERPLAGWGIGGWNAQWKARVEPELAGVNMPHNDFLWMGAQAGAPGALLLLWLVAAGLPRAWRRHDMSGRLGLAALLVMLVTAVTNTALRDASIGLSLWFMALVFQRLSAEPEEVWRETLFVSAPR